MKRTLLLLGGFWASLAAAAALVFGLGLDAWMDPAAWATGGSGLALALAGVGLLVADVLLVVPSSLLMVAHGAAFGVVGGTLLSTLGGLGAAFVGLLVGRAGGRLAARVAPAEDPRVARFLDRWGLLAVVLSRPVPVVAETVVVLCGATGRPALPVAIAAAAGTLPVAAVYAWAGAHARQEHGALLTVGLVLLVGGAAWWIDRRLSSEPAAGAP